MAYTAEQLEGLTDVELEGIAMDFENDGAAADGDDGDAGDAPDADDDAGTGEGDAAAGADAGDVDADAAAAAAADDAAQAAAQAAAAPVPQQPKEPAPSAPILVIAPVADADAKLEAIAARKETLAEQFDSGDITAKEFQQQLSAANKEELDITLQVRDAQLAKTMEDQRIQREWIADCNAFLNTHQEYLDPNGQPHRLLNEAILTIARMPINAGLSNEKALAKAHRIVQAELGEAAPAAAAPAAKQVQAKIPRQPAPPNIGNLPAAVIPDTNRGEFAYLDRLQKNPDAYEDALMKLSAAQKDKYLRS